MKTFAICFLLLAASAGFVTTVPTIAHFCSGGDDDTPSRPAFLFDPELTGQPEYRPLYFSWNKYYDNIWLDHEYTYNDNIVEWSRHFGGGVTLGDIRRVVYTSTLDEVKRIEGYVRKETAELDDSLLHNTLVQHLSTTRNLPFVTYLHFVKRCEPCVTGFYSPWDDKDGPDERIKDSLLTLLADGKTLYSSCPSDFLKLRYGYQLVRLAHYAQEFEECQEIYDKDIEPSKVESIMRYWAMEHKAGALRKLGLEAESAYLFSVVFDRCPGRRETALSSFRITSDSTWNLCVSLCKTPRERTTLYFLRGMKPSGDALEEMKNIYAIDPSSEQLNVLLVRELNKFEDRLLELDPKRNVAFYKTYESFENLQGEIGALSGLKEFVARRVGEDRVKNPDLWRLAQAYLEYMTAGYDEAQLALVKLRHGTTSDSIRKQIDLFQVAIEVTRLRNIDNATEDGLFKRVLATKHQKLGTLAINAFERLYQAKGDTIKAYLCNHDLSQLQAGLDLQMVDRVIDWRVNNVKTSVDDYFVKHRLDATQAGNYYYMPMEGLAALKELRGTILFSQNRLNEAIAALGEVPQLMLEPIGADPFKGRIRDCRDCDFAERVAPYNKLTLAKAIVDLLGKIKTEPQHAAEYHYLLGNAYYNMTHFGNAAVAIIYGRDPNLMEYDPGATFRQTGILPPSLDCSRALEHYDAAMKLAEASGDLEVASRCCFMAAKCEQNRYYVTVKGDDPKDRILYSQFRRYFSRLRDTYRTTKFYDQAIKECKYFNYFVSVSH